MISLAADEDFNQDLIRGARLRYPELDVITVQEAGYRSAKDPVVLEWAAQLGRPLLSHDVNTMTGHSENRLRQGQRMPGLVLVPRPYAMAEIIEHIVILAACSHPGEWEGQRLR